MLHPYNTTAKCYFQVFFSKFFNVYIYNKKLQNFRLSIKEIIQISLIVYNNKCFRCKKTIEL